MATTNPWKQFEGLLPKSSRIIGTVTSHNSNGTSVIALRDGSIITAKEQGAGVGQKALIENGGIVREVPNLPVYSIYL